MLPTIEVKDEPSGNVERRAIYWTKILSKLMVGDVSLRARIPSGAHLVILPSSDPELCDYNKSLAQRYEAREDSIVIYVEIERSDGTFEVTPKLPHKTHTYNIA